MTMAYMLDDIDPQKEIERLEWNHHNILVPMIYHGNFFPEHIQAYLNNLPNNRPPAVADVGTGTGIWLAEIAPKLPSGARLDGFDLVTTKFRTKDKLAANIRLRQGDILSPFPEELWGQYDVVHVRFLVLALKAEQWSEAAANLMTLLRPGGWLFWEETSITSWNSIPITKPFYQWMNIAARFEASKGRDLL